MRATVDIEDQRISAFCSIVTMRQKNPAFDLCAVFAGIEQSLGLTHLDFSEQSTVHIRDLLLFAPIRAGGENFWRMRRISRRVRDTFNRRRETEVAEYAIPFCYLFDFTACRRHAKQM